MKRLAKKFHETRETVEAYAARVYCGCGCYCKCGCSVSSVTNDASNKASNTDTDNISSSVTNS